MSRRKFTNVQDFVLLEFTLTCFIHKLFLSAEASHRVLRLSATSEVWKRTIKQVFFWILEIEIVFVVK